MGKTRGKPKRQNPKPKTEPNVIEELPWHERIFSEDDVQDSVIDEVYHLNSEACKPKTKKTCEGPNCFVHFGEYKKTPLDKLLGFDPQSVARDEKIKFSGLKNLGATCYMNSLLQCLYMNKSFRKMIYEWKSLEKSEEDKDIPLQLQTLFARMQMGSKSFADPIDFARSIQIKTSVQQDPQEFFKLFMSLLEERYSKEIVRTHFVGKYKYSTVCKNCLTVSDRNCEFTELELPIKGNSTLSQCLKEYLQEEPLTGNNQYFCEKCQQLQDATRRMHLTQLPEVLNFQLLRFVYDVKTTQKKKLKTRIAFPDRIDLAPYLDSSFPSSKEEVPQDPENSEKIPEKVEENSQIYQLTAVLTHKGASAYGGHYIAHVRDENASEWYKFDDEVVEREDIVSDPEEKKEDLPVTGKKKKGNANKETNVVKKEGESGKVVNSCNAYMLIYRKVSPDSSSLEGDSQEPRVPEEIEKKIVQDSKIFAEEVEIYSKRKEKEEERQKLMLQQFESVVKNISPKPDEEWFWIEKEFIQKFFKGEFSSFSEENSPSIHNENLLCSHGNFPPESVKKAKRISKTAWEILREKFGGGPEISSLGDNFHCKKCVFEQRENLVHRNNYQMQKQNILAKQQDFNNAKKKKNSELEVQTFKISKDWWKEFSKKGESNHLASPTKDLLCEPHGTYFADDSLVLSVPKEVWDYLSAIYPESIEIAEEAEKCAICTAEAFEQDEEESKKSELRKSEEKSFGDLNFRPESIDYLLKGNPWQHLRFPQYFVDGNWLQRWKEFQENFQIDRETVGKVDNEQFICNHGKTNVDPIDLLELPKNSKLPYICVAQNSWNSIVEKYGGGPEIMIKSIAKGSMEMVPEICSECLEIRRKIDLESRTHFEDQELQIVVKNAPSASGKGVRVTRSANPKPQTLKGVSSNETVNKLKLLIFQSIVEMYPNQQKLSYNGTVLDNDKATLESYLIVPGSTIVVEQAEQNDFQDLDDFAPVSDREEQGFKGTGLQGKAPKKKEQEEEEGTWNCKECTLQNPRDYLACEACGNPRDKKEDEKEKKEKSLKRSTKSSDDEEENCMQIDSSSLRKKPKNEEAIKE